MKYVDENILKIRDCICDLRTDQLGSFAGLALAMKFAHQYQLALQQGGFPSSWINSAISYKRLKAYIRQVRSELSGLGLDLETVTSLISSSGFANRIWISLHYNFKGYQSLAWTLN